MTAVPLFLLLLYALYEGLLHAFEADHILAVTNIVSQRNRILPALKDGIFWGLGHTSTIFLVGIIMIIFRVNIPESSFSYFEATVGLMLIIVAVWRLYVFVSKERPFTVHTHTHEHSGENSTLHLHLHLKDSNLHKASYGIGLVHGLAGSGALVVLVMAQIKSLADSLLYLSIFGAGSIIGMMIVAGVFSVPFSRKLMSSKWLRTTLILISSLLCLVYGCYVIFKNLDFVFQNYYQSRFLIR